MKFRMAQLTWHVSLVKFRRAESEPMLDQNGFFRRMFVLKTP